MLPSFGASPYAKTEPLAETIHTPPLSDVVVIAVVTIVKVGLPAIASVEVTSEQVARSRIGAVLIFGVLGLAAADRGTFLVHLKNGQTGYFTIDGYTENRLLGKLSPWLHALNIPIGAPTTIALTATPSISVADELTKLAGLRDSGVLTEDEFLAQKAKLLVRPAARPNAKRPPG